MEMHHVSCMHAGLYYICIPVSDCKPAREKREIGPAAPDRLESYGCKVAGLFL
jgi:hypothetical protein